MLMIDIVTSFFALLFTDIFYTYYLRSVQRQRVLNASCWSVVVYTIASVAVINYTTNHWLLIPAGLGAFCGTYIGMRIQNNNENNRNIPPPP